MAHHQHLKMYHEVHSLDMFTDKCKKVIYVRKIRPLLELATASSGPCAVSPRGDGCLPLLPGVGAAGPHSTEALSACRGPSPAHGLCDRPPESRERRGGRRAAQACSQCLRTTSSPSWWEAHLEHRTPHLFTLQNQAFFARKRVRSVIKMQQELLEIRSACFEMIAV